MRTIILLTISNVFMTFAWYGHLKYTDKPMWLAILASWGIAFFEYCFQVPANRFGHQEQFTTTQLKIIQEALTLFVFAVFVVLYMGEGLRWNHLVAFVLLVGAAYFVFGFRPQPTVANDKNSATEVHFALDRAPAEPAAAESNER